MEEKLQKQVGEIVIIGVIVGCFMVAIVNLFFTSHCLCYDQDTIYSTTYFGIKKTCEWQCNHFSEKEGVELTDIEPDSIKAKRTMPMPGEFYNYTLEVNQ